VIKKFIISFGVIYAFCDFGYQQAIEMLVVITFQAEPGDKMVGVFVGFGGKRKTYLINFPHV